LAQGGEALAQGLAASISLGCGQFCTNPGLLVLQRGPESTAFIQALVTALRAQQPHAMLTAGMRQALDAGLQAQLQAGATAVLYEPVAERAPRPALMEVDAATFLRHTALHEEVFGPSSLIVWCDEAAQGRAVLHAVGGALTVTLWGMEHDTPEHRAWVRAATGIAGRVLFAGMPTGVAVTAGQQHGGPWPSSTEPFSTSVGDAALDRFLRPVAYQDAPAWLAARQGQPG
jgi:NADP-dependent aldehyde dehydrogenase